MDANPRALNEAKNEVTCEDKCMDADPRALNEDSSCMLEVWEFMEKGT